MSILTLPLNSLPPKTYIKMELANFVHYLGTQFKFKIVGPVLPLPLARSERENSLKWHFKISFTSQ